MTEESVAIRLHIDEDFGEYKIHFLEPDNFTLPMPFDEAEAAKVWANTALKPALQKVMDEQPEIPFKDQVKAAIELIIKPT